LIYNNDTKENRDKVRILLTRTPKSKHEELVLLLKNKTIKDLDNMFASKELPF
jgi:hypothetical protein